MTKNLLLVAALAAALVVPRASAQAVAPVDPHEDFLLGRVGATIG